VFVHLGMGNILGPEVGHMAWGLPLERFGTAGSTPGHCSLRRVVGKERGRLGVRTEEELAGHRGSGFLGHRLDLLEPEIGRVDSPTSRRPVWMDGRCHSGW
jgi:hypothetical protein